MLRAILFLPIALPMALGGLSAQAPSTTAASLTEVVVLSTLHQFHAQSAAYSFETLSRVIEQLDPDVLAVELTEADLKTRRDQRTKQEYPRSIFPLLDRYGYPAVALEPPEPTFSELVGFSRRAGQDLQTAHPEKAEAFGTYVAALYEMLFERWTSVAAVNSAETDALLEAKHRYQAALFGELEAQGWEGWNRHFLEQILKAAAEYPGQRIVVVVGVEHAYWLRAKLREQQGVRLLDPAELIHVDAHQPQRGIPSPGQPEVEYS